MIQTGAAAIACTALITDNMLQQATAVCGCCLQITRALEWGEESKRQKIGANEQLKDLLIKISAPGYM